MEAGLGSLFVMLISLVILVVGIIKLKVHPVFALIIVAIGSAIGFGIPLKDVISTVTGGFGGTIGSIGIVIILGCTMGVILEQTSGALVLANTILKIVGKKRSSLAMAISGYLVSIPVFSDSAIVILSPVARALSARGGVPLFALLGALNAGILATHTMVPPTPGPLAAAGTLGADVGLVIAFGLISAFAYTTAATLYCNSTWARNKYPHVSKMSNVDTVVGEDFTIQTDKKLPNAALTFAVILVPVFLICANSFAVMSIPKGSAILPYLGFIGHPIPALSIGVILALFLDTSLFSKDQVYAWFDRAVESSGFIILATGAAGAFGAVLKASGVGAYLGALIASTPLPAVFVPFLVALLLSVSNGSATVSLLTGSAIILPLLPSLGIHPVIGTLAIAAGSSFFYHANASHFWVVVKSNDLSMKEGYSLVSVGSAIGSVAAIIAVWIMSFFLTV
ncbi:GntP family permease [Desulfosporosinus lacus]|uniref:Gluconate:H+ symporter, GntP family n=1 Tax=Desulfosporosinus lacus DSM 15449 TaxID=1121420 RepID=A0A1M5RKH6_9FIRM|nr:GntP family permease [Desulfosporosinus lacus]SHH26711.1 gluconate:H+ symporter, GntP family [Desulfosporosinus lacus DSM 15449]